MRPSQTILAPRETENLFGDFRSFLEQIGSTEGLARAGAVNASLGLDRVTNDVELKNFLANYRAQILIPVELPLICRAFTHSSKNEFSELIALDEQLAREPRLEFFASASKRIGQLQLKRLRPLRDQRGLQRYLRAVDDGQAHAWHTLVYGITLASFSLPLRQGLQNYFEQVVSGFINASACRFELTEDASNQLFQEMCVRLPEIVEDVLAQHPQRVLRAA